MKVKELFPTHVMVDVNLELARKLLPVCNHFLEISNTNCLDIDNFPSTLNNTSLDQAVNTHPVVVEALDFIIKNYLVPFLEQRGLEINGQLKPYSFFSSMGKGAHFDRHVHQACRYSGVMYLDVGENVPPLMLYDPRPFVDFQTPSVREMNRKNEIVHLEFAEIGKIVIWDSWLHHGIGTKTTDDVRKTFVFNL